MPRGMIPRPPHVLVELDAAADRDVRENLASNANMPIEILERYAADSNFLLRREVVSNPAAPVWVVARACGVKDATATDPDDDLSRPSCRWPTCSCFNASLSIPERLLVPCAASLVTTPTGSADGSGPHGHAYRCLGGTGG